MDIFAKTCTVIGGIVALGVPYLIYNEIQCENMRHEKYDYKIYIPREKHKERIFVMKDDFEIIDGVLYFKNCSPYTAITNFEIVPTK